MFYVIHKDKIYKISVFKIFEDSWFGTEGRGVRGERRWYYE